MTGVGCGCRVEASNRPPDGRLLPPAAERAAYERLRREAAAWLPAMRAICARHGLRSDRLVQFADGPRAVAERVAGCVARHRAQGAPEGWLVQMPAFLAETAPLYPSDLQPAIVSGDAHGGHLLVRERAGRWQLSGLFDFDDAQLG